MCIRDSGEIAERWFSVPDIFYFAPVPVLVIATCVQLMRLLTGGTEGKVPRAGPFLLALFLLFLGYSGLAISLWTPLTHREIAERWFSLPNIVVFAPVPVLVVATCWQLMRLLGGGAAAARNDTEGGMMFGHRLIANPL